MKKTLSYSQIEHNPKYLEISLYRTMPLLSFFREANKTTKNLKFQEPLMLLEIEPLMLLY